MKQNILAYTSPLCSSFPKTITQPFTQHMAQASMELGCCLRCFLNMYLALRMCLVL